MEITDFVSTTAKAPIALATLTTIAADRRAHGDDVLTAFTTQIEQRSRAAQAVLDTAQTAGRDSLLASEQRSYDAAIRERDAILGLQRAVEQRTSQAAFVPATQLAATETRSESVPAVLTKEQRSADWLQKRGGFAYQGERGIEQLNTGRIIRALAFGRQGLALSPLEQRVLAEGTDASGGFTVPEVVATRFIDRVRDRLVVQRAGAQIVPMSSDTLHLARLAQPGVFEAGSSPAGRVPQWKVENDLIVEADLELERVTFTARTLPILLKMSVELSEDSVNIDAIIERELAAALALELDRAALFGSGTAPEPRGLLNQAGVNVEDFGGVVPADYDFLIDAIGRVWADGFEPNAAIYNSSLAVLLAKLKSSVDAQPLTLPGVVSGLATFRTNQITDAGTSPDSTTLFVGDFNELMIGMRTSFRLEVSRTAGDAFERLQIWVRAYLRADVQLAHPEAFDVTQNIGL